MHIYYLRDCPRGGQKRKRIWTGRRKGEREGKESKRKWEKEKGLGKKYEMGKRERRRWGSFKNNRR